MMTHDEVMYYRVVEYLHNGTEVTVRAIRPEDKGRVLAAFRELDERSIYMRFFAPKRNVTDRELKWATEVDFSRTVALVACIPNDGQERIIGGCRYIAGEESDPPSRAEIAFIVEEDFQGLGLGSILLRHLALIGREQGISRFDAEVLPSNTAMLRVFRRAGLPVTTALSDDMVRVAIFLDEGEKE